MFTIFSVLVLLFGFVLLFGAPYLPTRRQQSQTALDLLNLKPGQTLYELGCGDGRVLRQAAERGLHAVGYELNPLLVITALLINWRYRKQVKVIWGSFWRADLSQADGVFVFLLDRFMPRLDKMMNQASHKKTTPLRLASFTFKIPGKAIMRSKNGIFLYCYDK